MNKLIKFAGVAIFLLVSLSISGQSHYTVHPNNVLQVTTDILADYGQIIDITDQELKNHLNSIVKPANYCSSCDHTLLEIDAVTETELKLKWAAIPDAVQYELKFKNLKDGSSNTFTATGTSLTVNNLPDAAYAFSIVAQFNINNVLYSSKGDVLILEMPILTEGDQKNCQCDNAKEKNLIIDGASVTWNPFVNKKYRFLFTFSDNTEVDITLKAIPSYDSDVPLSFLLPCTIGGVHPGYSNTVFQTSSGSAAIHMIYDNGYYIQFFSESTQLIQAKLFACGKDKPSSRFGTPLNSPSNLLDLKLYPNPVQDLLNISLADNKDQAEVQVYNETGRLMHRSTMHSDSHSLDIQEWPVGVYQIKILNEQSITTQSFIKMK